MVGEQCPGIATGLGFSEDPTERIEEIFPVRIAKKDLLPCDSTPDHMMQCVWGIYPGLPGHRDSLQHQPKSSQVII